VWFAVLATALVVVASPASAASVASLHTSDVDFQNATTNDFDVSGTGDSAYLTKTLSFSETNSQWDLGFQDYYTNDDRGLRFTLEQPATSITADLGPTADGEADTAYLKTNGGSTLDTVSVSGGEATFTGLSLQSGTTYRVELANPDAPFNGEWGAREVDSNGGDSGIVDVVGGSKNGGNANRIAGIESLTASAQFNNVEYESQNHTVGRATSAFADLELTNAEATVQVLEDVGGSWSVLNSTTVTSSGEVSVPISPSSETLRVRIVANNSVGSSTARINEEGIKFVASEPSLSDPVPEDGTQTSDYGGNVTAELSDPDFGTVQGDNVTVVLSDEEDVVATQVVTSNGTVEFSYSALAGENSLSWEAADDYGTANDTLSQSFTTPSTLYIRQETNTSELITGTSNLTLRFFGGDVIVERNASDGQVDMTGLPATEEIVVVARADGYYSRRAVLGSLYEQQSIYMLSENESAVFNEFVIDDRVGLFSSNQTKIRLEKGITQNGSTEWKTLTGDYLGAGRSFSVTLQQDARYRVYVENQQGDVRNVGPHIATADGVVPVPIGQIVWEAPKGDTYKWKSSLDEDSNTLQFEFVDEADETTNFEVKAYVKGNESNPIFEDSQASLGTYQATAMLTENQTKQNIIIEWSADRNGEEIGDTNRAGAVGEWDVPVDQRWLTSGALLFLVAITWLMPSAMARVGSVMVVAVAFGMSSLGIVPIPLAVIGISGATALLGLAAEFRR
jgi:hypothetical protein